MSGDVDEVKYPRVVVTIPDSGPGGNSFAIMANVQRALRRAGVPQEEIEVYKKQAMSGDYDNLLNVTERWVTVN